MINRFFGKATRVSLMATTSVSSGLLVLASSAAIAQSSYGCTVSGSDCTFTSVFPLNTPLSSSVTGADGSDGTAGAAGASYTYKLPSSPTVGLPDVNNPSNLPYAVSISSTGGDGSKGGPSDAGAGGAIILDYTTIFDPSLTLKSSSSVAPLISVVTLSSMGGDGADNNTNDKSNGAPGGAGGAITYNGQENSVSLSSFDIGSFEGTGFLVGLDVLSKGGYGGRGNESLSFTPVGGDGGDGGAVTVMTGGVDVGSSSVPLTGESVYGVRARSVGGRGPDDYNSSSGENEGGGGKSAGGSGGSVTLTSTGQVKAYGTATNGSVRGIYANSVGGDGGWSYNVGIDSDFTSGGTGGAGGQVTVTLEDEVEVTQSGTTETIDISASVLAQSAGGTGGVGQSGQPGGAGGGAGTVTVTTADEITATGRGVDGIFARSIGGVGGAGLEDANQSTGGVGGDGGTVNLTIGDSVTANSSSAGNDSGRGVVAQSIGNFGGAGSDGNVVFGNPGSAGAGGDGGIVSVTVTASDADLTTHGTIDTGSGLDFADGILAQSIGGGGGTGGDFNGLFGGEGGAGGKGGSGDDVSVVNNGSINTNGVQANGIIAQSIGGGGGSGGISDASYVALGGSGGSGGTSGAVSIANAGDISSTGYGAIGILAQAIVGAGGAAGVADAAVSIGGTGGSDSGVPAGTTEISNTGSVTTAADAAIAILAQSIGGGGGSATGEATRDGDASYGIFALGTDGGDGGEGGVVTVTDIGTLMTSGAYSFGLVAQSIGGGGGNGGNAFAEGLLTVASAAIGGQSGGGGDGGNVTISNTEAVDITTSGTAAAGLLAQSIGGGGGLGGDATTETALTLVQLGIGGAAEDAGSGGSIDIAIDDTTIATNGNRSAGLIAQSVGGGGGSGGSGTSETVGVLSVGFALGGTGGAGGDGGDVSVGVTNSQITTATQTDTTSSNDAIGLLVQSIGGGGGQGGAAVASAITIGVPVDPEDPDFTVSINAQFAMGGKGGDGGRAGSASATLADGASIATNGAGSHGILAQAVGGGGGSGGDASTATTTIPDSTQQYDLTINGALGGTGGDGGGGGTASAIIGSATPASEITTAATSGAYANAMLVQSIGGGGGNSGLPSSTTNTVRGAANVSLTFDVGAANLLASELGADGGSAMATLGGDGSLFTAGAGSRGIVVQSIGGGGGTVQGGEISLGGNIKGGEDGTSFTGSATVNLGQSGGAGGVGGAVTATTLSGSTIATSGIDADGILAQSIGGGGGLAGTLGSGDDDGETTSDDAELASDDEGTEIDVSMSVSVGGRGGTGGDGGAVTLDYASISTTAGDWADGAVVQSIGGGGGTGGTALSSSTGESAQIDIGVGGKGGSGGDGGAVTASFLDLAPGAYITTSGYMANGVVLQSIGGGGGQGGDGSDTSAGSLTIGGGAGGSGGTAGDGGVVSATGFVNLLTNGNDAHGMIAQSIGGGGGTGGVGSATSSDSGDDTDDSGHAIELAVGGKSGSSGDGGAVSINLGANTTIFGDRSFGMLAQSVGAGGGLGGAGSADNLASVSLGGAAGVAGNGDTVSILQSSGFIRTHGLGGHGIVAQSVGGGGGVAGDTGSGPLNLTERSGGGIGNGGTVSITVDASLSTTGDRAHGIVAQSIGGGGGFGGDADGTFAGAAADGSGTGGQVAVTIDSGVAATGEGSIGVFAQSEGASGNGQVEVTVNGTVTGGSGADGAAIFIADGEDNLLTVAKGASVSSGSGGVAVNFDSDTSSTLTVDIYGTMSGNVTGQTANGGTGITVNNYAADTLTSASLYEADVNNFGRLFLGSGSTDDVTTITGDLNQTGDGTIEATADFATGQSATLLVKGDAALDGTLSVAALSLVRDVELTVISVEGALSGGLEAADTPAVDYLAAQNIDEISLRVAGTHFDTAFKTLSNNQREVAAHLDEIFIAGSGDYAALLGDFSTLSAADDDGAAYGTALASLSPGGSQAPAAAQIALAQGRLDKALSCPTFSGDTLSLKEESCSWAEIGTASIDQNGASGYDGTITGVAGGAQFEIHPDWFAGVALGYESSQYNGADGFSSVDGDTGYVTLALKRQIGDLLLSGAVGGSFGSFDISRGVSVSGVSETASGQSDIYSLNTRLRAAYSFGTELAYIRPFVDLDVIYTHAGGYTEKGAGIYNLKVDDQSQTAFVGTPAVEVGTRVDLKNGWTMRLFALAGVSFSSADSWTTSGRLDAAPDSVGEFDSTLPIADTVGRFNLGLHLYSQNGFDFRGEVESGFGDDYTSLGGTIRMVKRF